ncbi:MAG: hypothetical protein WDO24_09670 [Pseudomonadota bacterium]
MLPPVTEVVRTLIELLGRPTVQGAIAVSGAEFLVAFLIAIPLGAAIGIVIAESDYLGEIFKPMLFYVFSVPKSIFLPMFILVFGIGFQQKVAYAAFSTVFVVIMCATRRGRIGQGRSPAGSRAPMARRAARSSRGSICRA